MWKNGEFHHLSYFYLKWICYSKVKWTIQIKNSFCNWDSSGTVGKGGESVCLREPELHWAVRSLKSRRDRTHLVRVWWSEPPRTTHGGIQRPRPWSSRSTRNSFLTLSHPSSVLDGQHWRKQPTTGIKLNISPNSNIKISSNSSAGFLTWVMPSSCFKIGHKHSHHQKWITSSLRLFGRKRKS